MKILYVLITTSLFCNYIIADTITEIQDDTTSMRHDTIVYLSEKWQLSNLEPFIYPSVFNHYIARGYSNLYQQDVVLKLCESNDECKALQYLKSDGIVDLLDYDEQCYALLLQYIPSRGSLADLLFTYNDDNAGINAFVDLFNKIHVSPKIITTADFQTVQNNFKLLKNFNFIKIPENLLQKAIQLSDKLFSTNEPQYLLHCDLHCRNILQYEDNFIAIDPWAATGPLEYEVASFLASPTDFLLLRNDIQQLLQNRLDRLSHLLHFSKQRLKDCTFMRIIFLACLCETRNKNDDWIDEFIQVAEIIDQLDVA